MRSRVLPSLVRMTAPAAWRQRIESAGLLVRMERVG